MVRADNDAIQTETGAREGVLTAAQIDNLSVISRSALELLRILPGVVAPYPAELESVSFNGGANHTSAYTVNGVRGTNNTVQLDGSSLIDIGTNNGSIVTLNNDMVQEVKVQSANYAAEHGSGAVAISAVTKSGSSVFHGTCTSTNRDYRFAANDRSNTIFGIEKPKSAFNYPGGNIGGPVIVPGWTYTKNRDKLFFFVGLEVQRQQIDMGARRSVGPHPAPAAGSLHRVAGAGRAEPRAAGWPGAHPDRVSREPAPQRPGLTSGPIRTPSDGCSPTSTRSRPAGTTTTASTTPRRRSSRSTGSISRRVSIGTWRPTRGHTSGSRVKTST